MPAEKGPDLSLFLDILKTLEKIPAPYMVIGANETNQFWQAIKSEAKKEADEK